MNCRHCHAPLQHVFMDLGEMPPSNAYLDTKTLHVMEISLPLKIFVCDECWLVQTEDYATPKDLFRDDYAYFSSTSKSWLKHAEEYVNAIYQRLRLSEDSFVVEIGSNDGYLLKHFVDKCVPCLGIEPTLHTAEAAQSLGVPVVTEFFTETLAFSLAREQKHADLIIGNNVYAHVPDINDFTRGLKRILKPQGTISLEFPHLLQLIAQNQFDTAYHEHFSYLSLAAVNRVFNLVGLKVFDLERLPTHGGSLRIYASHAEDPRPVTQAVSEVLGEEDSMGLGKLETYESFQIRIDKIRDELIQFMQDAKTEGKKVVAYGAAAKGNTLLNYAGIKSDLLPVVFDAAPSKQGKFLPGSHIPIESPDRLSHWQPDYVLILPWNLQHEVVGCCNGLLEKRVQFVTAVPSLRVFYPEAEGSREPITL